MTTTMPHLFTLSNINYICWLNTLQIRNCTFCKTGVIYDTDILSRGRGWDGWGHKRGLTNICHI